MPSFSQWATENGREFGGRIVRRERGGATAREARLLGIGLGEEILRFTRVRTLDGRAVMVERSTWAPWVIPVIDALPDDVPSLFGALDFAGVRAVLFRPVRRWGTPPARAKPSVGGVVVDGARVLVVHLCEAFRVARPDMRTHIQGGSPRQQRPRSRRPPTGRPR
ncbi:UTRA domain-containing protein [Streptomyces sp. NPDC056309]|uniref:UTRA domain-containing protein n=1 Tax=unclassified Streptomyces TaxID=2593676 RepID=UPI0035DD2E38